MGTRGGMNPTAAAGLDVVTFPLQAVAVGAFGVAELASYPKHQADAARRADQDKQVDAIIATIRTDHQIALRLCAHWEPRSLEAQAVDKSFWDRPGLRVEYSTDEVAMMFATRPELRPAILSFSYGRWPEATMDRLYRVFRDSPVADKTDEGVLNHFSQDGNTPDWVLEEIAAGQTKEGRPPDGMLRAQALNILRWKKVRRDTLAAIVHNPRFAVEGCAQWDWSTPETGALSMALADASIPFTDPELVAIFELCPPTRTAVLEHRANSPALVERLFRTYRPFLPKDEWRMIVLEAFADNLQTPGWIIKEMDASTPSPGFYSRHRQQSLGGANPAKP